MMNTLYMSLCAFGGLHICRREMAHLPKYGPFGEYIEYSII